MALFGGVTRFLDKYLFGYALGTAAGPSLEPFVQSLANAAWSSNQVLPPEYRMLVQGVAEGKIDQGWAKGRAAEQGISGDAFDRLVTGARIGPGTAAAFQLWRRGIIDAGGFRKALRDDGTQTEWIDALANLRDVLLSPAELANARQQGFVDEPTQKDQAARQGVTAERAEIQYQLAGLPPGAMDALGMLRRGIVDEATYRVIVREGHTKTKYTDALLALRDQVLSARDYAELWLRGWLTEAEAKVGGKLTGYGDREMELLYLNRGRPATPRQVHIGYARGGTLAGAASEREAFTRAVRNSNIRTEYEPLLWAGRYTYPSAFVIRGLTQAGTFDGPTAERILIESGWPPQYAKLAADDWAGTTAAGPSTKWADRARSHLFTAAQSDYVDGNADEAASRAALAAIGVSAAEQDVVLRLWATEIAQTRRDLTQAQVLKLVQAKVWTPQQGQAALEDLGMTPGDATALLATVQ